jgi:hypothetical protein
MDRDLLEEHLAMADRHVTEGERHVALQRELVSRLILRGAPGGGGAPSAGPIENAKLILAQFEELQTSFIGDRDQLRSELAKSYK